MMKFLLLAMFSELQATFKHVRGNSGLTGITLADLE